MYALTHSLGCLIGSGIMWCVIESLMVGGPVDGMGPDLGVASLAVVESFWSFFLFGMVVLGHVAMGIDKL